MRSVPFRCLLVLCHTNPCSYPFFTSFPPVSSQVRGPFYLEDKAKVPAGPACLRLVAVLMYGCRLSGADGERIDHVASRGKCAKLVLRIGDITSKGGRPKNEPCLFIVNLQVVCFSLPQECVRDLRASSPLPQCQKRTCRVNRSLNRFCLIFVILAIQTSGARNAGDQFGANLRSACEDGSALDRP